MATNWLGSAHEQVPSLCVPDILRFIKIDLLAWVLVDGCPSAGFLTELRGLSKVCEVTTAYAQAPSFQKMATQMGIIDVHQFLPQLFSGKSPLRTGSAVVPIVFRFRILSPLRLCNDDQFIQLHLLESSNFDGSAALRNLTFWDGHLPKLLTYTLVQDNRQGFVKLWRIAVYLHCLTGRRACEDKGESWVWKRSLRNAGCPFWVYGEDLQGFEKSLLGKFVLSCMLLATFLTVARSWNWKKRSLAWRWRFLWQEA